MAEADAKGIARYYQLTTEDGKKAESPLENYKEKIVHIVDGNSAHNKISYKTYYPSSQKDNKETDSGTDKTTTNNGQTEQTTESITAQGKKDATEKVKRTEKSSEQTLDTTCILYTSRRKSNRAIIFYAAKNTASKSDAGYY